MEEKIFSMQKKFLDPNFIAFMCFGHPFNGLKKFQSMANESFLQLLRKAPPPQKKPFFHCSRPPYSTKKKVRVLHFPPHPTLKLNNDCKKILTAFT